MLINMHLFNISFYKLDIYNCVLKLFQNTLRRNSIHILSSTNFHTMHDLNSKSEVLKALSECDKSRIYLIVFI